MPETQRTLSPELYVFESREPNGIGRRMTVFRLDDGRLVVHHAIDLDEPALLDALGKVAYILVPNAMHTIEAPVLAERYPDARVIVPEQTAAKLARKVRVDGTYERDWPKELDGELSFLPLRGTRLHEVALVHHRTRTLVVSDLAFNFTSADFTGPMRLFMRLNRALDGLGPTRLFLSTMRKDRAAFAESVKQLLEQDFDRVIVGHGQIVESGGRAALRRSFAPVLA